MIEPISLSQLCFYLILAAGLTLSVFSYPVGLHGDPREVYTMNQANNLFLFGTLIYTAVKWWRLPHLYLLLLEVGAGNILDHAKIDQIYLDTFTGFAMFLIALLPHIAKNRGNTRALNQMGAPKSC